MLRIPTVEGASEQETCGFTPDLPPVNCVTLGKSFQLSGLQSAHLYTERSWHVSSNILLFMFIKKPKIFCHMALLFLLLKEGGA